MSGFLLRKKRTEDKPVDRYLLWALIAIELFMSFSFLGYLHIEPISLTFVYIPVLAAGCLLGSGASTLVGAVFGLASMWKASAFYVGAGDAIFSPVSSGRPIESILLSVGSRVLFGLIIGLLYREAKKSRHPMAGVIVVTSIGRTLHTFLVYAVMQIFFPESGFGVANTFQDMQRWDFIPFLLIVNGIIGAAYRFCRSPKCRRLEKRIMAADQANASVLHGRKGVRAMILLTGVASFCVALYFTNRIGSMMESYGLRLSEEISYDLMHLQIQFLLGIMSLAFLTILILSLYQKDLNYLYYEARLDGLTGLLGRQLFFQKGEELLESLQEQDTARDRSGCFIIMDVDRFKEINDRFGHPAGDQVLAAIARELKRVFEREAIIGRLGGDEFIALVYKPMERASIEARLNNLKREVGKIALEEGHVTCSVGVIPVEPGYSLEELYLNADRLLYEAKKKGKDRFVFGYRYTDRQDVGR